MPIRRYRGRYPRATSDLYRLGLLRQMPVQKEVRFFRDYGLNIIYRLKGCTPEKFRNIAHLFLEAAFHEAERYPDYKWRFARFDVQLNRTAKGRKSLPLVQTYTAGKHVDSNIMVYGPGYEVDDKIFLKDKVEEILDIPARYTGKVKRQRPYTVVDLEICLRAGEPFPVEKTKEEKEEDNA